jgi:hypothetical protein
MTVAEFGHLLTETDVDAAVLKELKFWLPTYLSQLEREREMENRSFARPKPGSFQSTLEDDTFPDGKLPAIVATTALTEETHREGTSYSVDWRVVVSAIVRGRTPPECRALASMYGATVRRVLVQQAQLRAGTEEPVANGIRWIRSRVVPVPDVTDKGRYLAAGVNEFFVYTDDSLDAGVGPLFPEPVYTDPDDPDEPPDPGTSVGGVTIDIEGVPVTETPGS